jgi:hypothetical protein
VSGAASLPLFGYSITPGRQGNPKLSLLIRGKGCDFFSLFVLYDESGIRKRFRTGSARPDWPRLNWAKRNHALDPGSGSGLCLPERKTCSHGQQRQDHWQFSKSHHQMYAYNCVLVNNDEARMSKHEGNPNDIMTNDHSGFVLPLSFVSVITHRSVLDPPVALASTLLSCSHLTTRSLR